MVQEYRCYMWTELGKRLHEYRVQVLQEYRCCRSTGVAGVQVVQEYRWYRVHVLQEYRCCRCCRSTGVAGLQVLQGEQQCYMWGGLG